jgi:hypothetical protein
MENNNRIIIGKARFDSADCGVVCCLFLRQWIWLVRAYDERRKPTKKEKKKKKRKYGVYREDN